MDTKEKRLTDKQELFIDYYIETGSCTEAARLAGYKGDNLNKIGSKNLAKLEPYIKERIADKKNERIAKQDEILETLTRILRREEHETVVVTTKTKKSYYDENGKKVTEEQEVPQVVEVPTRISDVNKAAELMGKRYRLWVDRISSDGQMTVEIVDDLEDTEDDDA